MEDFQMLCWTPEGAARAYSILHGLTRARDVRSDIARSHAAVLDALPALLAKGLRMLASERGANNAVEATRDASGRWTFTSYDWTRGGRASQTVLDAVRTVRAWDLNPDGPDALFAVTQERIYLLLPAKAIYAGGTARAGMKAS